MADSLVSCGRLAIGPGCDRQSPPEKKAIQGTGPKFLDMIAGLPQTTSS
jgi:hypothetical protein